MPISETQDGFRRRGRPARGVGLDREGKKKRRSPKKEKEET